MLYDERFASSNIHITGVHAMLMTNTDYVLYLYDRFPYEWNELVSLKPVYESLIMEVWHLRMPMNTNRRNCRVLNALVACWPSQMREEVAVIEFSSIQTAHHIEPDITQCKRLLLSLIRDKWNVRFKGKELIVS